MPGKDDFISDGYAFEHRVVGYLESEGYFAIKSHMSKGIVDVIGIKPGGDIRFIQCKLSEWNGPELDALEKLNEKFENAKVEYVKLKQNNSLEFKAIEELTSDSSDESLDKSTKTVLRCVKNLPHDEDYVEIERVVEKAVTLTDDLTEEDVSDKIEKLKRQGDIFEPKQGYLQVI